MCEGNIMSKSLRHELNAQGQFTFLFMLSLQISVGSSMLPGLLTGEWVAGGKIDHTSRSRCVVKTKYTIVNEVTVKRELDCHSRRVTVGPSWLPILCMLVCLSTASLGVVLQE